MLYKFALCDVVTIPSDPDSNKIGMVKTASGRVMVEPNSEKAKIVEAEIKKHPTALFFRAKAIKADEMNSNGDYFSEEELLKGYKSFEGVPFFTNHDNQNIENAKGKIIFAEWVPEEKSVYTIAFVDREAFPNICRSIEEEYVTGVSMGALNGESLVVMSDLSEKRISDIVEGEEVLSAYGNKKRVKMVHSEYLGKPMYCFDLATYHKSPLFTDDHPIFMIEKNLIEASKQEAIRVCSSSRYEKRMGRVEESVGQDTWRTKDYNSYAKFTKADGIQKDDFILIPSRFKLEDGSSLNSDFYYIVGAYLGDGYLKKDRKGEYEGISFCLGLNEIELAQKITTILKKYSKSEPCDLVCEDRNGLYISLYDRKLAKWFSENIGSGSKTKRLKFNLKFKEDALNLLSGYLDTDGCIAKKTNVNHTYSYQFSSANIGLLEDIQSLLISLDCISRISSFNRVPSKNSVVKVNTIEHTLAVGSNNSNLFNHSIKFGINNCHNAKIKAGKAFIVNINGNKFMACPVKSISVADFSEPVYDITVEDDECYIADGVAVHNCSVEYSVCNICGNKAEKTDDYCFIPGTPVLMSDLSVKNIEDVIVGDIVIDASGTATRVTETFVHDVNEAILSIRSKKICGELQVTQNHPFLVERRGEFKFIPAEYLDDKESLFTPVVKLVGDNFFDIYTGYSEEDKNKICKLLGYFIAEGYLMHNTDKKDIGINISLHSDEKEFADEIISISESIFGKTPEVIDRNNYNHKCRELRIYHPLLVSMIYDACLGKANEKILSNKIVTLEDKYIKHILAGYIDGDGYSDAYGRLILTTASKNLAYQLIHLLAKIGITASIGCYLQNKGPNNREELTSIYRVQIAMMQSVHLNGFGIKATKSAKMGLQKVSKGALTRLKNSFDHSGYIKSSAYGIEELWYCGAVHNIETESHSYVANNIAVHNCTHIRNRKGRKFSGTAKNINTGEIKTFKNQDVFEYNYGLKFIELSAVVDPACASCHIEGIIPNDDYLKRVANMQNQLYMVKTAAIEKQAGQQEISELEQVLQTLESIAVGLVQNRKQVEVEFASDLVGILADLQKFTDELIGAGYGNIQDIPGTMDAPQGGVIPGEEPIPDMGATGEIMPVAEETPIEDVGTVSGAPGNPPVNTPSLPITAPIKPMAFETGKLVRMASLASNLLRKIESVGDNSMAKRRTKSAKREDKETAIKILSNSWKEKQDFFEYIKQMPSLQDNNYKLSVKKTDDSFIIVAEDKDPALTGPSEMVWTYEDLNEEERSIIKESPKEASIKLLETFASSLKTQKEGVGQMVDNITVEAGAKSVNKQPEVITEAQLEEKGLYHSRTDEVANSITQKQLDEKRKGEKDVITEAQLAEKANKLNPRTDDSADVITEAQLKGSEGASPRGGDAPDVITEKQLEASRENNEPDVITEKQLDNASTPWERVAKRDKATFKSAGEHMKAVIDVIADNIIATGCTTDEITSVAKSLISSTQSRYNLVGDMMTEEHQDDHIDYAKRLAFWSNKNVKVSGISQKEASKLLISGLRKVASDETINPEVIVDAIEVITEGQNGVDAINKAIDEKMAVEAEAVSSVSVKDELRASLAPVQTPAEDSSKEEREEERAEILASVAKPATKEADHMIETSFEEIGVSKQAKRDKAFKSTISSFAKGALASQNIKLAAITNVTINGDTIQIAVQTDGGEESVEIPIGGSDMPAEEEVVPEVDFEGEGLENSLASSKSMKKEAQAPMGGGIPGTPGGVAGGPGSPEAGLPGATPDADPIQALTTDEALEDETDEIPTAGKQQMPYAICPECGSSDVDISKEGDGNIKGTCNSCTAEYEALINKTVEFKIIKPTKSVGEDGVEVPEVPEVPALPVAAQTRVDKNSLTRIASNQSKHGHVCPACGMTNCKVASSEEGHHEFSCPACGTDVEKDVIVNVNNPEESYLRVKWDVVPQVDDDCEGCKEAAEVFASVLKVEGLMKKASASEFPKANCMERIARMYGSNAVASFGPCKGKPLADCVCGQLERLGLTKVRHLEKLASTYSQEDPMDECMEAQSKKGFDVKEASAICGCLKKKFASEIDDNPFMQAFAEDIESGKETILTAQDLGVINDIFTEEEEVSEVPTFEDIDIGDDLEEDVPVEEETVVIEVSKDTAEEIAEAVNEATEEVVEEVEEVAEEVVPVAPEAPEAEVDSIENLDKEKEMALAMQTHKLRRVGEEVVKVAGKPTVVKDIEGDVEAGVPRAKATMGNEGADNIDVPMAKPSVPRANAEIGKEGPDNINPKADLPDVPVDSSYMGDEKNVQKDMPAINNKIKGTVIAEEEGKTVKEAKQLKEVDSVEGDVEAGVPRAKATMGNEGADNIDVPMAKPSVPRANAEMGNEGADNINPKSDGPDVPVDNSYMGDEKNVQKDMPVINDKMLKNVQQSRDVQMDRIATARKTKAIETAAKLLAQNRITEEAYEDVIEALSYMQIDRIASVADKMYPKKAVKTAHSQDRIEATASYSVPAIVMESKSASDEISLTDKISNAFTIGNKSFDENLTRYGDK